MSGTGAFHINVKGVLHGISGVYDHMIRQGGGHIVNIASIYGNYGIAGAAVSSTTKAAVITLSNALRVEGPRQDRGHPRAPDRGPGHRPAVDGPAGVAISDITIRATGEDSVF